MKSARLNMTVQGNGFFRIKDFVNFAFYKSFGSPISEMSTF